MAEENEGVETSAPQIDEDKLAAFIQSQVEKSFSEVLNKVQPVQSTQNTVQNAPDPVDDWLNPRIAKHTAQSNLNAALANDRADFYQSDSWDNLDEILDDGESDVKAEKREIRGEVEKLSQEYAKRGMATPRETLLALVMGDRVTKNSKKFREKMAKKSKNDSERELTKARNAADLGTSQLSSLGRNDIYAMSDADFEKAFGEVGF